MGMLEGKVALITGAGNSNCAALSYANARSSKRAYPVDAYTH